MASLTQIEGKYEILEKLHDGGMGSIYRVQHRLLKEERVVKTMRHQLAEDAQFRSRFLQEAQLAASLKHPNIAQIHDFTVDDRGTGFIVMEYIDGVSLKEILVASGAPGLAATLEIARQALRALGFLHRKGYVHRDISPDNVMLSEDVDGEPEIKLIDLGIAKKLGTGDGLTTTGHFLGKLRYSSPEHFGEKGAAGADERSDVYSFGLVLYELLTGQPAVLGNDLPSLSAGHLLRPPQPFAITDPGGQVPEGLRRLALRALDKDPLARFADAEDFAKVLLEVQTDHALSPGFAVATLLAPARELRRKRLEAVAGGSTQIRLDRQFGIETTPTGRRDGTDVSHSRKTEIRLVRHEEPSPDEDTGVYETITGNFSPGAGAAGDVAADEGRTRRIPDIAAHLASVGVALDPEATQATREPIDGLPPPDATHRLDISHFSDAGQTSAPPPEATQRLDPSWGEDASGGVAPQAGGISTTGDAPIPEATRRLPIADGTAETGGDLARGDGGLDPEVMAAWEEGLKAARRGTDPPPDSPPAIPPAVPAVPAVPAASADRPVEVAVADATSPLPGASVAKKDPTGWAAQAGEILYRFPMLERIGLDLHRLRHLLGTLERHRLPIAGGLASVVIVAVVLGFAFGGGEAPPPPVAPPPPPEIAPPPPPPPVVEEEPSLHPELVAARSCLDEGDAECARLAIETLADGSVYLTDPERDELAAITAEVETIETALAESTADLDALGQKLVDSLASGPVTDLRDAVDALKRLRNEDREAFDGLDQTVAEAFDEGDKIIIEYRRMWGFKNKNDPFEVIPLTQRLIEIYPPYTEFAEEHRETAAGAVETRADELETAGDLLGAASQLRLLRQVYPDRAGLDQRIAGLERLQQVDEKVEEVLAAAEQARQQREPEKGLALLAGLKIATESSYADEVARSKSRLEELFETMDRSAPVIGLPPAAELSFKRKEILRIELSIVDEYRVEKVVAYARAGTEGPFAPVVVAHTEGSPTYVVEIDPEFHDNKRYVQFYVEAEDPSGHKTSYGTEALPKVAEKKGLF